jgi:hypothetical protein
MRPGRGAADRATENRLADVPSPLPGRTFDLPQFPVAFATGYLASALRAEEERLRHEPPQDS